MISHQELSDRMEIQNILALYCEAIDNRDWEALDDFFTEDAIIDYTATGGLKCTLPEAKTYLDRALQQFNGGQHMIGVPLITFNGDEAKSRTILFNPMIVERENQPHVFLSALGMWMNLSEPIRGGAFAIVMKSVVTSITCLLILKPKNKRPNR